MKKIVIGIVLVMLVLLIINKLYCFSVMNKVYDAIVNFKEEENRYYSVTIQSANETLWKEEIFLKDNIVKCNEIKDEVTVYCEWEDIEKRESYSIDLKNKSFIENDSLFYEQNLMKNLPNLILNIYQEDKFHIGELLKIRYILPDEYENQECYKIVATGGKMLIINKDTYLPVYYSVKHNNLKEDFNDMIENIYEFKVGEVTEEDVSLPDLIEYMNNSK